MTGASYTRGGKYLIVGMNEDAAGTVRLLDAATLQAVPLAGMPAGVVRGLELSNDDAASPSTPATARCPTTCTPARSTGAGSG